MHQEYITRAFSVTSRKIYNRKTFKKIIVLENFFFLKSNGKIFFGTWNPLRTVSFSAKISLENEF